ncbi:hypothetical protein EV647_5796 [Kribbella sp. VKM Ac-2566]|nr:hypothetical protein EV647_5796 [Kribbella sp. VKM Ac-2566]
MDMSDSAYSVLLGSLGLIIAASELAQQPREVVQVAVLITAGLVIVAFYLLACVIWPYANCTRCAGDGKSRSLSGKKFRNCPRCKGTGRRRRIGRRLLDRRNNHRNR